MVCSTRKGKRQSYLAIQTVIMQEIQMIEKVHQGMMGSAAISWSSKKQSTVTLSTTEAEFVAPTTCACQAISLRNILEELLFK